MKQTESLGLLFSSLIAVASAQTATLQFQGVPATVTVTGGALEWLEAPRSPGASPAIIAVTWPSAPFTFADSNVRADALLELRITLGLSFASGAKVISLPENIRGELLLKGTGAAWELSQFNFGTFSARITHDTERAHVGMLLPVLLKAKSSGVPGPIHAALIIGCSFDGGLLACTSAAFGMEPLVAASFPGEPSVAQIIRQLVPAPRVPQAAPLSMLQPPGRN